MVKKVKKKTTKANNRWNWAIILPFLTLLYLPTLTFPLLGNNIGADTSENRELAKMPELDISEIEKFPKRFDNFYNDNLPYRKILRESWTKLNFFVLRDSTTKRVVIGSSDGPLEKTWLFYSYDKDGNPVEMVQGFSRFSEKQINDFRKNIEKTTEELDSKGVDYYVLVIPNKESVYREYLPHNVKINNPESRTDLAIEQLRREGVNNIIYPKDELVAGKEKAQTYYRQDTHWNDWGAFIGFSEFMKIAEPGYSVEDVGLSIERLVSNKDLVKMLGVNSYFADDVPMVEYLEKEGFTSEHIDAPNDVEVTENDDAEIKKTIMVIGDSYRTALVDYFAKTFEKCIFMHKNDYQSSMVEEYRPDIVVSENVERYSEKALGWRE